MTEVNGENGLCSVFISSCAEIRAVRVIQPLDFRRVRGTAQVTAPLTPEKSRALNGSSETCVAGPTNGHIPDVSLTG